MAEGVGGPFQEPAVASPMPSPLCLKGNLVAWYSHPEVYRTLQTVAGGQGSPCWEGQEGHTASMPRDQQQSVP